MTTTSNQPTRKLRYGRITAAIWRNSTDDGPFYSVTLSRTYRDSNGQLQNSTSLSGSDLLVAAQALQDSYRAVSELREADRGQVV